MKLLSVIVLILSLTGCGAFSSLSSTQETTTEVQAQTASVSTSTKSEQDAVTGGNKVLGDVDAVNTSNITGISPLWFMIGALVLGMVIPQPKFIKIFW